jgi:hemoglobin
MFRRQSRHAWLLAACTAALVLAGAARAQGQATALERKDLDRRVYEVLRDVINTGADLYNGVPDRGLLPDPGACYHLYHGALLALKPLLDHRADLQKSIDAGLIDAERQKDSRRQAFALRTVIDDVRAKLKPDDKAAPDKPGGAAKGTLWERLGGEKNVSQVVDDFVASAAPDPKVNFFRDGKYKDKIDAAKLKKQLVDMISAVSGGPHKYTGRDMKEVHKGMGITDAEFDALGAHLKKALDKNGARQEDAEELLKIVGGTRKEIVEKTEK